MLYLTTSYLHHFTCYSGLRFWPLDPRASDIVIADIAHALSQECRFNGHTKNFYSVAEHSLLVSQFCDPEDALWGLLHDASEAYLRDLPSPVKYHKDLLPYRDAEEKVMKEICKKYGLPVDCPKSVKEADHRVFVSEGRELMKGFTSWNVGGEEFVDCLINCFDPVTAEELFISRFKELTS